MRIQIRDQIKSILARKGMTMKVLAEKIAERLEKPYSLSNLSAKLKRETITYNELVLICEILNYDIEFIERN